MLRCLSFVLSHPLSESPIARDSQWGVAVSSLHCKFLLYHSPVAKRADGSVPF